jgi:hypothetical protein
MPDKPDTVKQGKGSSDEDIVLNRLILMSRRSRKDKFVRPDEGAITAYLMGAATAAQEGVVKEALMRSAEFRREILGMAEDIDALSGDQVPGVQKKAQMIRPPSYKEFLAGRGETTKRGRGGVTLWARLVRWRIPQLYVPVAVTAGVIVLMIIKTGVFPIGRRPAELPAPGVAVSPESTQVIELAQATLVEPAVDPGFLISNVTRGAAIRAAGKVYDTPNEAAMAAFMSMLTYDYDNGRFNAVPPVAKPASEGRSRPTYLILVNEVGREIQRVEAGIPIVGPEGTAQRPEAWVLTLPARDLYRIEMQIDSTKVIWTPEMGDTACIALVTRVDGGYKTVASELELR